MRRALVGVIATMAMVAFASTGIATAKAAPNCVASTAKRCTLPTEAQIRKQPVARRDGIAACSTINGLVAQSHLNQIADPSKLGGTLAELSRTKRHGPLAPAALLRDAKAATMASAQVIALGAVQAWCGGLGVPV